MTRPTCIWLSLLVLTLSVPGALPFAYDNIQGAQYIVYSGNLTGATTWSGNINSSRCAFDVGPYGKTKLFVGVNAPWDTNPFYFALWHRGSDCGNEMICYTHDRVFNLQFSSSTYGCYFADGSGPCTDRLYKTKYTPEVYIDLNSGTKTQRLEIDGETGYQVDGGTWVGNDTMNWAEVESECDRYSWDALRWSSSTPLNFTLAFSNQTASLTVLTDMINPFDKSVISTLNLTFTGSRNDTAIDPKSLSFHDLNPIQLKADSPSTPHFSYLNNSDIYFANITGDWYVAATPITVPSCTASYQGTCTSASSTQSASKNVAIAGRGGKYGVVERCVIVTVVVSIKYFL